MDYSCSESPHSAETGDIRERLWVAIAAVRDAYPRLPNDADTWDIVDAAMAARQVDPPRSVDVYVVRTPHGFTEGFDRDAIDLLERLGLIRHERDDHVMQDGSGRGVGPLHRFYREADRG